MSTIVDNSKTDDLSAPKVAMHTLGCRLNFSETGSIAEGFSKRGYRQVPFGDEADVVFINTCTVTDGADSTCRNLIRKAVKSSPHAKVVVAGCYAQMESDKVSKMTGVDLVLGTQEKYKVFDYLEKEENEIVHIEKNNEFWSSSTTNSDGHTRAFLKIQDGCNYICSFCIIPQARGRSRTITIEQAKSQAESILKQGFKEIILTGVNIGEYENISGERLTDLVENILDLPKLERLRLSSVEPNTITKELLELLKSSNKSMDHFHVPMQSGCDDILKSMRRKYTVSEYKEIIQMIKSYFPNAGIGADIIAGYPGETQQQFQQTVDLLKELPITHFHVFPYSKRQNTTAVKLEGHIQYHEKKRRVKLLEALGEQKLAEFAENNIARNHKVLFEKRNKSGLYEGYTENFIRVECDTDLELKNQILDVYAFDATKAKLQVKILN